MNYFEREIPIVKINFNEKEYEFDTIKRFTTRLENMPVRVTSEIYYFRVAGISREFLADFKHNKIKSVKFCHTTKDENGAPFAFVDTLVSPTVKIDQSLFTNGEPGDFDFTIYN